MVAGNTTGNNVPDLFSLDLADLRPKQWNEFNKQAQELDKCTVGINFGYIYPLFRTTLNGSVGPAEPDTPFMTGIIIKNPQFVYKRNEQTGEAVIFCTRPVQFKAYVFFTVSDPHGFRLLPEKDTEQIRRIMKRMHTWFAKWHALEGL